MSRNMLTVVRTNLDVVTPESAVEIIARWATDKASRYICIVNVHIVATAARDPEFNAIVNFADLATPDGMPVAWTMRFLGSKKQPRVDGPDLMLDWCERAAKINHSIFLYGSTRETLDLLQESLSQRFPKLQIAGSESPPFRALTDEEDDAYVRQINESGASVVFVGLGAPKQEQWMFAHRGRVNAVMIGVGAAFDFHAGTVKRAPKWMQESGLEWLYRLLSEPRRLWKRYLTTNTLFVAMVLRQLIGRRFHRGKR